MATPCMHLNVLLPFQIFADRSDVTRVVVQTPHGSYGLLPQRLDCVMALTPGILTYATLAEGEIYLAVDEGILVKSGNKIGVSVRHAIGGTDLGKLHDAVTQEFLNLDEQEKSVRTVMAKLETGFIRRFAAFQHGQ